MIAPGTRGIGFADKTPAIGLLALLAVLALLGCKEGAMGDPDASLALPPTDTDTSDADAGSGSGSEWDGEEVWPVWTNPTGNPVGGAAGYSNIIEAADAAYVVSTKSELQSALSSASSGDIVYVTDSASIDLTSESDIIIPAGVTLASGRGRGASVGALLFTRYVDGIHTLFRSGGEGVRITGLRIEGGETNVDGTGSSWSSGIFSQYNIEVDNNELSGFSRQAVNLKSAFADSHSYIHHNYIHHNIRSGFGYGVAINTPSHEGANATIEANVFDWNRHSIAATGNTKINYIARYNLQLGNGSNHAFDVHGDDPNSADHLGGNAGNTILIYGNTFHKLLNLAGSRQLAINIRGLPYSIADIYDNYFYDNRYAAVRQRDWVGNTITDYSAYIRVFVHENCFSCVDL